jgi:hypothetical protein
MSKCGFIEECEPGAFLATVTPDNQHYALVDGVMVPDRSGDWLDTREATFGAYRAFGSLEAAKAWVAWHFERDGTECWPWEPGYHAGTWRAWPSNAPAQG